MYYFDKDEEVKFRVTDIVERSGRSIKENEDYIEFM